jgi:membrane protein
VSVEATLREEVPGGAGPGAGSVEEVNRMRTLVVGTYRMVVSTIRICLRYRVTGLAAEAGFFALLSLPPLLLGLVGSLATWVGPTVVGDLRRRVEELAVQYLRNSADVNTVVGEMFDDVVRGNRYQLISVGFLLSLWSGSRALNVFIDTISIMYGLGGHRGIVRTRVLSFSLYIATLVLGIVVIPLVLLGPGLLSELLNRDGVVSVVYWPVVVVLVVGGLTTLYHLATPVRTPWRRDLPGALLALAIWLLASVALRRVIAESIDGASIYGPLSAPIVVLIWLYFLAIAVLIGAALNAAIEQRFPVAARVAARKAGAPHPSVNPMTPVRDKGVVGDTPATVREQA